MWWKKEPMTMYNTSLGILICFILLFYFIITSRILLSPLLSYLKNSVFPFPIDAIITLSNEELLSLSLRWSALLLFGTWWRHYIKHFPHFWPSVRGIHRWIQLTKDQWRRVGRFLWCCRNELLDKHYSCRWFEMPWRSAIMCLVTIMTTQFYISILYCSGLLYYHWDNRWPLLLAWINFNPSMDK